MARTALIVGVPGAEPVVGRVRALHDPAAALGVPPHITIVFPFLDTDEIVPADILACFAGFRAFPFVLDRVERFPGGVVWLHPEPSPPFVALTMAAWRRWPERPPYGGAFATIVPHLTISETTIDVDLALPIHARATEITLIAEASDGRWHPRLAIPLDEPPSAG